MRRKQKRLLQVAGLLVAALLFFPNVGLWSLYRDRVFDNSLDNTEDGPGGGGPAPDQVRDARRGRWLRCVGGSGVGGLRCVGGSGVGGLRCVGGSGVSVVSGVGGSVAAEATQ
ncbi:Polypeptide N-acetylgalactosaminyltransferase [Scophthalmus maximus]|uniref:Polypeptide N-acetylgalactosaminyltransferase n=1 Tax=Scophthalmus maximus TaxID=52904 RepID=A0A2U9BAI5_SCOMX|nr:Polypeptide N-acetylgalactosaminyltransferase [Scophthalmus maximus]